MMPQLLQYKNVSGSFESALDHSSFGYLDKILVSMETGT